MLNYRIICNYFITCSYLHSPSSRIDPFRVELCLKMIRFPSTEWQSCTVCRYPATGIYTHAVIRQKLLRMRLRPIEALENRMFATAIEVNGKMLPIRLYVSLCVCLDLDSDWHCSIYGYSFRDLQISHVLHGNFRQLSRFSLYLSLSLSLSLFELCSFTWPWARTVQTRVCFALLK